MIWKVVSPCIEESRFLVWSWWGLCKKKRCPFDHLNKKAFDWSNSGIMTRRNLKKSLRPKIMHHLDETLASSINSQHILDCKWKPIIFSVSLIPIDVLQKVERHRTTYSWTRSIERTVKSFMMIQSGWWKSRPVQDVFLGLTSGIS